MEKEAAREQVERQLERLSPSARAEKSDEIRARFLSLPEQRAAMVVMSYVSIPGEVDTAELMRTVLTENRVLAVPLTLRKQRKMVPTRIRDLERDLVPGAYGIPGPRGGSEVPVGDIDVLIVPARGFDREGNRLGRGAGFYDRFMAHPDFRAFKVGLAFEAQVLDALPHDEHDLPVDVVVTESQLYRRADQPD